MWALVFRFVLRFTADLQRSSFLFAVRGGDSPVRARPDCFTP